MGDPDDSMRDFLNELDMIPTPQQDTRNQSATLDLIDNLLGDTDTADKDTMTAVKTEIPKAAMAHEIRHSISVKAPGNPKPQTTTPKSTASSKTAKPSPTAKKNHTPVPTTRGGITMYERSMLQMEQRERRLMALQQTLMADCTFSPRTTTPSSGNRSRENSPDTVFDRLYSAGTAASKARMANATTPRSAASTPTRGQARRKSLDTIGTVSPGGRLEVLFEAGQKQLRDTKMTVKVSLHYSNVTEERARWKFIFSL
jgi:hypothetical protein